ncbi:MAG: bifunctional UDP-N-acetylglucosamine diphosphorylase/glucosamine-1-phosphate N-acetyltransferase GlmU [Pseudomonadota bacterium]|nr:bifunctional UDP-N-acetylglucosamine diphosphorylase/glucosamine-1-phosphate N-acetyltransferase GlmU [Pseudomonadota bacterium]
MPSDHTNNWKQSSCVVILAAGKGSRMLGSIPKALQPVCGKTILQRILDGIQSAGITESVLVINPASRKEFINTLNQIGHTNCQLVEQNEAKGTAHALMQTLDVLEKDNTIVVLGDTPFISPDIYAQALNGLQGARLISTHIKNPTGMGRVIRGKDNKLEKIIEQKDLSKDSEHICEINTGIMAIKTDLLHTHLNKIGNDNAAREYYLTDIIQILRSEGLTVDVVEEKESWRVRGVNTPKELSELEASFSRASVLQLLKSGVQIKDIASFQCLGDLKCGQDVHIHPGVVIEGKVSIGSRSTIGAYSVLKDVTIGNDVEVKPFCVIEDSKIGNGAKVGPFAYCRQGTVMKKASEIGCFVESKQTILGEGSKAKHLSYLGNLTLGASCNVGAGVIHCNYDGLNKHTSILGDGVFIGANSSLVGPVKVASYAMVAAASVITKDIESGALAIARSRQTNISNWKDRKKATTKT